MKCEKRTLAEVTGLDLKRHKKYKIFRHHKSWDRKKCIKNYMKIYDLNLYHTGLVLTREST